MLSQIILKKSNDFRQIFRTDFSGDMYRNSSRNTWRGRLICNSVRKEELSLGYHQTALRVRCRSSSKDFLKNSEVLNINCCRNSFKENTVKFLSLKHCLRTTRKFQQQFLLDFFLEFFKDFFKITFSFFNLDEANISFLFVSNVPSMAACMQVSR